MTEISLSTENITVAEVFAATILTVEWLRQLDEPILDSGDVSKAFSEMFEVVNTRFERGR